MTIHEQAKKGNNSTLYKKWVGMKRRCLNKNDRSYYRYGGSGVTVCDKWMNFIGFYEDMADTFIEGLSIDRIDNKKGYSKENCRWIPLGDQNKNKRNVPLYTHNGQTMTSGDWEKQIGMKKGTFNARMRKGWDLEKALEPKKETKGYFLDQRGKYRVELKKDKKRYFLGRYDTEKEAKYIVKLFIKNNYKFSTPPYGEINR